ncbi:FeoB-associated Cys-rich membrane protein [Clostridium nigeriense]|uniref:FeoB-associated Cys-rich membrane protein n=1 Tax=Clostridium nigeriense TaxID=1805470 RepID=UPI000A051E0C|nr:FeoB-associated Cys-rich membrane protein [Clostridium nigeriense]
MEILITLVIVAFAAYIIFKTLRKSSKGGCSCGSCSNHCPMYEEKEKSLKIEKK